MTAGRSCPRSEGRARVVRGLALGLLAAGCVLAAREMGWLERLELGAFDALLTVVRPHDARDPRLALVGITESDVGEYGHPLSDARLARTLALLQAGGPRAIGVDLYRDRPVPPGSSELEAFSLRHPNVVFIEKIADDSSGVPPPSYVVGTSQVGFSDLKTDSDGRLRRALIAMSGPDGSGLSLSARLAMRFLMEEGVLPRWSTGPDDETPGLHFGSAPVPRFRGSDGGYADADDAGYQVMLGYPRGKTAPVRYTLGQVLRGELARDAIRGRIVIVGSTSPSVRDQHATPFGTVFGIEYHAQVASELLDVAAGKSPTPRVAEEALESAAIVAAALAAAGAALLGSATAFSLIWLGGLAAIGGGGLLALQSGWWLPVLPSSLAWLGAGALVLGWTSFRERADRRRVMDLFGRFLARDVAEAIWRERDAFLDGARPAARRIPITVLMADLQGYTAAAERLDPSELMTWISSYLEAMARVVGACGGVVDDYAGDGVKANFGVPIPRVDEREIASDARAAVDCALGMAREMESLHRRWAEAGLPAGRLRVGIHSGEAVVGTIGSADRLKFTSIGDVVNTAARLEAYERQAFARDPGADTARILVSGATVRLLGPGYATKPIGEVGLKGKSESLPVFRVLGRVASERIHP